jgi:uncharacterized membrane protein YuzA (DUF378 family)
MRLDPVTDQDEWRAKMEHKYSPARSRLTRLGIQLGLVAWALILAVFIVELLFGDSSIYSNTNYILSPIAALSALVGLNLSIAGLRRDKRKGLARIALALNASFWLILISIELWDLIQRWAGTGANPPPTYP